MIDLNEEACGFLIGWFLGSLFIFFLVNFLGACALHAFFPFVPLLPAFGILVFGSIVGTYLRR